MEYYYLVKVNTRGYRTNVSIELDSDSAEFEITFPETHLTMTNYALANLIAFAASSHIGGTLRDKIARDEYEKSPQYIEDKKQQEEFEKELEELKQKYKDDDYIPKGLLEEDTLNDK